MVVMKGEDALRCLALRRHDIEILRGRVGFDVDVEETHLAHHAVDPNHFKAGKLLNQRGVSP